MRPTRIVIQLLIVILCGRPLAAQAVGGVLKEAGGAPVSRAMVALLDSAGAPVAQMRTAADGRFLLVAPAPGT